MTLFEHLQSCSIYEMADIIDELLQARNERFLEVLQNAGFSFTFTELAPQIRQQRIVDELMKEVGDGE